MSPLESAIVYKSVCVLADLTNWDPAGNFTRPTEPLINMPLNIYTIV